MHARTVGWDDPELAGIEMWSLKLLAIVAAAQRSTTVEAVRTRRDTQTRLSVSTSQQHLAVARIRSLRNRAPDVAFHVLLLPLQSGRIRL